MFIRILVVIFCILLNGFFAMAEISIIRSKKSRLERLAKEGSARAKMAVFLINSPGKFLSSVQIGVTLSSIFAGAVSANQFALPLSKILQNFGLIEKLSFSLAFFTLGVFVSYLTLVFGELIPKKISLLHPEKIALFVSPFMYYLTKIFLPFVAVLNASSEVPLNLLGLSKKRKEDITEEEIVEVLEDGLEAGVIERYEHRVISQIFRLSDLPVTSLMTPRTKVLAIRKNADAEEIKKILAES
ncbi:MAG: hemolysin family protein, partial [Acidobacteria bacterium]|nr:hemolysin family protein [Acidobacteriota bacterium]